MFFGTMKGVRSRVQKAHRVCGQVAVSKNMQRVVVLDLVRGLKLLSIAMAALSQAREFGIRTSYDGARSWQRH